MENENINLENQFKKFEREIEYIDSQLKAVESGIKEMNSLNEGLSELIGKTNEEIFAPIGRGIFVKTKIISEELLVDVGEKNFIKKSIPETKEIVKKQIEKLKEVQKGLIEEMKKIDKEITTAIKEKTN